MSTDIIFDSIKLRALIDHLPVLIAYIDQDQKFRFSNKKHQEWWGLSENEILGKTHLEVTSPLNYSYCSEPLERSLAGESVTFKVPAKYPKAGERFVQCSYIPDCDDKGRVQGVFVLVTDLTAEHKALNERAEIEQQLRVSQKMESLGTLAGGIAHDFNNMLSGILGYSGLAQHEIDGKSPIRPYLEKIDVAANRARDLIQHILTFSQRPQMLEKGAVDLVQSIKEVVQLVKPTIPATIKLDIVLPDRNVVILANASHMHQVILNLLTNAAFSMKDSGGLLKIHLQVSAKAENAIIKITDTGCGIQPELINRIFEPYFTTKEVGQGSGLGLAVVHGIVSSYGGKLDVESRLGQGSCFTVSLPLQPIQEVEHSDPVSILQHTSKTAHILFVDDEEMLVSLGADSLQALGYKVTRSLSAKEALEMLVAQPEKWDLLITDQTMPEMTGSDLISEVLKIRPELPVILTSGYSAHFGQEKAYSCGASYYLPKPYSFTQLVDVVGRFVDK